MNYVVFSENLHPESIAQQKLDFDNILFANYLSAGRSLIRTRMDPSYVDYKLGHNRRVGEFHESILLASGFDETLALARRLEAEAHDFGKLHLDQIPYWKITLEKQLKSDFDKAKQREHPELGPVMTDEILPLIGVPHRMLLRKEDFSRFLLCDYGQINHHAPFAEDQGPVIRSLTVSDAVDGQLKTFTSEPLHRLDAAELQVLRAEAIKKLSGERYTGQLCPKILEVARVVNNVSRRPAAQQTLEKSYNS